MLGDKQASHLFQNHLHHALWQVALDQSIQSWQVRELANYGFQRSAALGAKIFAAAAVRLQ
jgi:hypothetical protein